MEDLFEITKNWRKNRKEAVRIITFGSSNTELHWHSLGAFNWVSWLNCALREWVGRHVTVINQGISGETAKDLLERIERDVISYSPHLVIITVGGNDVLRGFSIEEYRENLIQIIEKVEKINAIPVLQTYYCPLYEKMAAIFQKFPEFVEANRALASEKNILLIDQYKYFFPFYENDRENYSTMMLDALHVNHIGNIIMGIIACRHFCLPDPQFLMADQNKIKKKYLDLMSKYCELPPRRTKRGKIVESSSKTEN